MKFQFCFHFYAFFLISSLFIRNVVPTKINQNTSFLIVGTSVPAVIAGWILSQYNVNVTMCFSSEDVDNNFVTTQSIVYGQPFILPKMQPQIFESSKKAQHLVNKLNQDLNSENGFYLQFQNKERLSLYGSSTLKYFINNLVLKGCIKENETSQLNHFISALMNYNYTLYRQKYSNITLAEFANQMMTPKSFMDCAINLFTINTAMTKNTFNAADALARINFYFFQSKDPLKSYFVNIERFFKPPRKWIMNQMVDDMKSKNVKFIPNHKINAFYVDAEKGRILGDLSNPSITYDYIILGDTLTSTKTVLQNTHDENSGAPKIFQPLENILTSLNKYSQSVDVASIKIWLSLMKLGKPHITEVTGSPYPYSIQSIKLLTAITIHKHTSVVLEVIVVGTNGSRVIDWNKVNKEMMIYFPSYDPALITYREVNWVDMGAVMDVNYGTNRLNSFSVQLAGISNLILAGGWLDPLNSNVFDFERDVVIAIDGLRNMTFVN